MASGDIRIDRFVVVVVRVTWAVYPDVGCPVLLNLGTVRGVLFR
jgi:hypothetical protein